MAVSVPVENNESNESNPKPFKRPPPRIVEVLRIAQLTPRMVRITLGGGQMEGFESNGPAEHFRIFLPDPETGELVLPSHGPDGNAFPEDKPRPISRAYTPRQWRPDIPELDVDIALHDHGPGAAWARNAQEGDAAVISGRAGGAYFPDPSADSYLIGGDEASLPAIATVLEALPSSTRACVFLEVRDANEEQPLTSPAPTQIWWLHRQAGETPGRMLAETMRDAELPQGKSRVWVSCEATAMREIRSHFLNDRSLDRSTLHTQGYWKAGAANHPDHDMGEDA